MAEFGQSLAHRLEQIGHGDAPGSRPSRCASPSLEAGLACDDAGCSRCALCAAVKAWLQARASVTPSAAAWPRRRQRGHASSIVLSPTLPCHLAHASGAASNGARTAPRQGPAPASGRRSMSKRRKSAPKPARGVRKGAARATRAMRRGSPSSSPSPVGGAQARAISSCRRRRPRTQLANSGLRVDDMLRLARPLDNVTCCCMGVHPG